MSLPLSEQFAVWARAQPADEAYDFSDIKGCAFFQFLRDAGYPVQNVGGMTWLDRSGKFHDLPRVLLPEFQGGSSALVRAPRTFGALADRLALISPVENR